MTPQGPVSDEEAANIARRVDFSSVHGARILLTGAQGMLGNYTAQAILEASRLQGFSPASLVAVGRRGQDRTADWAKKFSNFEHQRHLVGFESDLPTSDVFLHFASAASPTKYADGPDLWETNLGGAISGIAGKTTPEKVLFVSSGEVYGAGSEQGYASGARERITEPSPRSPYPNSKLATEFLLRGWNSENNKSLRIGRVFHTFGPGLKKDDGRSFGDILWSASEGKDIRLRSNGSAERNFAYIEDTVVGLLLLLFCDGATVTTDIGGQERLRITEFAQIAASQAGVHVDFEHPTDPAAVTDVTGSPPPPNTAALEQAGWRCEVSVAEGIRRSLASFATSSTRQ